MPLFTGLSFFAQTWWQLLIFRFLAALGIGGEWAVGASLLSETWPRRWRPWLAAVLQTGVNLGVMLAGLRELPAGRLSAPLRFSGRRAARPAGALDSPRRPRAGGMAGGPKNAGDARPVFRDLFRGPVRRTTVLTLLVCALSLTAHWAFLFWYLQHLRDLPELAGWTARTRASWSARRSGWSCSPSIAGNFVAAWLARRLSYRRAIACCAWHIFCRSP